MAQLKVRLPQCASSDLRTHRDVLELIRALPPVLSPEYIDLSNNVERVMKEKMAVDTITYYNIIAKLEAKELQIDLSSKSDKSNDTKHINDKIEQIEQQIDVKINTQMTFKEFIHDYIDTEIKTAETVINIVKSDSLLTKNFLKDKKGYNSRVN
jgi:hypothetical protein